MTYASLSYGSPSCRVQVTLGLKELLVGLTLGCEVYGSYCFHVGSEADRDPQPHYFSEPHVHLVRESTVGMWNALWDVLSCWYCEWHVLFFQRLFWCLLETGGWVLILSSLIFKTVCIVIGMPYVRCLQEHKDFWALSHLFSPLAFLSLPSGEALAPAT